MKGPNRDGVHPFSGRIVFGAGTVDRVPEELETLECARVLVIAGGPAADVGAWIAGALGRRAAGHLTRVGQYVPENLAAQAVATAKAAGADGLCSVGGGSATGLPKRGAQSRRRRRSQRRAVRRLPRRQLARRRGNGAASPLCHVWEAGYRLVHAEVHADLLPRTVAHDRALYEAREPLGLPDMAKLADEGARAFRNVGQDEMIDRLRHDRDRMLGIAAELTDEEWSGLMVPHKYMGPLPACFYPIFQVVDYSVHSWDIREGTGHGHGLGGEAADLLVPVCLILWQYTCELTGVDPFTIGLRITSGHNAGDTRAAVSGEGISFEPGDVDDLPTMELDPGSFVLTAYGRANAGTFRGDRSPLDRFANLFFRI